MVASALISSLLAFGSVRQILSSLEDLHRRIGDRPGEFLLNISRKDERKFSGFKHRFVTGEDLFLFLRAFSEVAGKRGGMKEAFTAHYVEGDLPGSLHMFVSEIGNALRGRERVLKFLLPDPAKGSACKRLFLFMRWMVRRGDGVDFGIFTEIYPSDLVIPLDTHVGRIARLLGFTRRKTNDLKTAIEITGRLKGFDPEDPVKYDFALTRIGIVDGCRGSWFPGCEVCELNGYCVVSRAKKK